MQIFTFSSFSATKIFFMSLLLLGTFKGSATSWTTATAGAVNTLANWTNGASAPTSFTTPGDTWTINKAMTLPASVIWTLGTVASTPDSVIFAPGGSISMSGAGSLFTMNFYGTVLMNGGSINLGGAGTTSVVNIYGNVFTTTGVSYATNGATSVMTINTHGNYMMSGDTVKTGGASGAITMNMYGSFTMTSGLINSNGAGCTTLMNGYGNYSISGSSAMTNTGAGCISEIHFKLLAATGTMMIDNTSTGSWSGTNVYVDSGCAAQLDGNFNTTTGTATYGLTVNGILNCPSPYTVNGTRIFKLNGVATLKTGHATGINGAIITTGTKTFNDSANYGFNGTVAQVTGTYLPATLYAPDTISVSNPAGVTLTQSTSTTGKLIFTSGILNTGTFTMTVPGDATSVSGAGLTSYVNGTLVKTIAGYTTVNYEVGDMTYVPMMLTLSAAGTAGSIALKTTNGLHPNVATSGISSSYITNHYWTITNMGAAGPVTVTPTATYSMADIIGGANTSFLTQEYNGTAWLGAGIASTNTTSPYTTAPGTGIALGTLAGDYIFGRSNNPALETRSLVSEPMLRLFPNPNKGTFSFEVKTAAVEVLHVRITNAVGALVKEFAAATNQAELINVDEVPGIYYFTATGISGTTTAKFIVQ